ncbi:hypothetical protein HYZ41_02910 [archaeon]|nr:hypothetical protein [archaeon]
MAYVNGSLIDKNKKEVAIFDKLTFASENKKLIGVYLLHQPDFFCVYMPNKGIPSENSVDIYSTNTEIEVIGHAPLNVTVYMLQSMMKKGLRMSANK